MAGAIRLLDAASLRPLRTLARLEGDAFTAIGFSPDGRALAFGTNLGASGIYDVASGQRLLSFPRHTTNNLQGEVSPRRKEIGKTAWRGRGEDSVGAGS